MSYRVAWTPEAQEYLLRHLGPARGADTDREIQRFAALEHGPVRWEPPYHRLRVGRHEAALTIERESGTVNVIRLYAVRRP